MEASSLRQHHPHALPLSTDPPAVEKHLEKAAYKKHEQHLVEKRQHPYPEVVASYHPLHKQDRQEKPQLKQQQKQLKQSPPQLTFNPAVDNKQDLQAFLKGVVHRYEHWKTKEMNDPYSALARMAAAAAQAPALPVPPVAQHQQQPQQQEEAAIPMAAPSAPIRMAASPSKGGRSESPEVIVLDDDDDDEDDEEPATAAVAQPAVLPPQQRKRKLPTAASTLAMPPPQKRKILGGVLKTASTCATASPASSNKKVSFCTSLVGDSADQATIMTEADVDVTTGTSRNVMLNKRLQMIRSTRVSLKRAKLVDVYKVDPELVAPPNETEDERRRRMERINGRRKRAKKLIELDHLNDQMMTYTERNTALKEENEMIRQKILVIKEAMKRANGNPHDDLVQAAARDALTMFVAAPTERLQMEEQAAAQQAQAQIQENFAAAQCNDQQAVELNPARGATLQQQQQQQAAAMRRRALQQYQNRPQAPQQQQQMPAQAQEPRSPQPQQQEQQQPKQQKGPRRQPRVGLPDAIPDQRPRAMQQSRAERQKMQRAIMKAQAKRAAQQAAAAAAAAQANGGTANQNQQDAPPFPGPGVARPMFPATGQTLPTTAQPQQQQGQPQQAMTMPNGMQMPAGMPICTQAIVLDKDGKPQPILMMMPNPAAGAANGANGANGGAAAPQQFFPMMAQGPNGMTMMMPQMMMGPNGTPMQAFVPMAMPGAMATPTTAGTATAPNAANRRSTEQASATSNKSRGRSRDRTATDSAGTTSPRATSPFLPSNTARLSTTAAATTMDAPASPPQLPNLRLTVNNPTNVAASRAAAVDARTSFQQYTSNMQMRLARANATAAAMEPTTAAEPPVEDDSEESEEEQQHHLLRARAEAAASPAPSRSADPPGHQSDYLYPRREAERNLARSNGSGNRAGAAVARGRPDAPEDPDSEGGDVLQVLPAAGATAGVNNSMYRNTSNYASSGASVASQSSASYSASTATEEQKARKKKRKQIYPSLRNYRDSGSVSGSSVYSASSAYSSSSETEDSSRKKKKRGGVYPSLRNYKASSKSAAKKAPPTAATAGMAVPAQLLQKQGEDLKKMQQKQKLLKLQQKEQQRQQRKQQRRMQKKGRIAGAAPQPQNFQLAPAGMDMQGLAARDLTSALVATAAAACDGPEADEAFRKAMRSHGVSEFDDMPTDDLATANSILVQLQPPRGGSVSSSQGDRKPAAKGARGAVPVNNRAAAGRPRACDP